MAARLGPARSRKVSDETACFTYAVFLATIRMDHEQAITYGRGALRLDLLSLYSNTCMAWIFLFAGEYDLAIEQAQATLDLYRDTIQAWYVLGLGQVANKKYEHAVDALQKAVDLARDAIGTGYLGHTDRFEIRLPWFTPGAIACSAKGSARPPARDTNSKMR